MSERAGGTIEQASDFEGLLNHVDVRAFYSDAKIAGDRTRLVAIMPLIYTHAIVTIADAFGYEDRWCYHDYAAAKCALDEWDGCSGTEPQGWHRHPASGRRRPQGDASEEYVTP
jgi:hypothetical protein